MRLNHPVTNNEIPVPGSVLLVSKTDPGGRITFVNEAFVEISGYQERELLGAPHNILRHPDMPQQAFADLWATVKAGQPWEGLVKNRTKTGDFYWVRANVTPIVEAGNTVGYISVRSAATPAQIAKAEELYRRMREGSAKNIRVSKGAVLNDSLSGRFHRFSRSLFGSLVLIIACLLIASASASTIALFGMSDSNELVTEIAQGRIDAAAALETARSDFSLHSTAVFVVFLVSVLFTLWLARGLRRAIHAPMTRMEEHFAAIARGDVSHEVGVEPAIEFQTANAMLRSMRARLLYQTEELAESRRQAEAHLKREMLILTEVLEGEIQETVRDIFIQAERLAEDATQLKSVATALRENAVDVAQAVEVTSFAVQTVASATEELEASSSEILAQISNSSRLTENTRQSVEMASEGVGRLSEASQRIGNVVTMIQNIAGQTRMLALNATIEAARAGEAGKGFAVVAEEVKALARQTDDGISDVNTHAQDIGGTTQETVETVEAVVESIRRIDSVSSEVARAAGEQRNATAEIMSSAGQAADLTRSVAESVRSMAGGVESTSDTAHRVMARSQLVTADIGGLERRLQVVLRTSAGGDRRGMGRIPVAIHFRAVMDGIEFSGYTGDLSLQGALLVPAVREIPKVDKGSVVLEGIGEFEARFLSESRIGLHVRFDNVGKHERRALRARIEMAEEEEKPYIALARGVAGSAAQALESAVMSGSISEAALFDTNYEPVTGTDPQQFTAPHTELAERLFGQLIEPPLTQPGVVFCCITDHCGYVASHNRIYSEPQRENDRAWNAAHSRNRRIFDDRTGILAARNLKPHLSQTYARDMGAGAIVLLKEIDAPITVRERHWGAVRLGLKLE